MALEDELKEMASLVVEAAICEGTQAVVELVRILAEYSERHLAKMQASQN